MAHGKNNLVDGELVVEACKCLRQMTSTTVNKP